MDAPASGIVVVARVVVVAGAAVVTDTVVETSESGASLLHAASVAHIERIPRQATTLVGR